MCVCVCVRARTRASVRACGYMCVSHRYVCEFCVGEREKVRERDRFMGVHVYAS